MNKLLALSALGPDGPAVVEGFADSVVESGCNILECRVTRLGTELGIQLLVAGNWRTVARLEQSIPATAEALGLEVSVRAANEAPTRQDMLPYAIDVTSMDQPGIVHRLVRFFTQRDIAVGELASSTYVAQQTGAPMISLHMSIAVPAGIHIATLREDFMILCDEMNLDAVLEPIKI